MKSKEAPITKPEGESLEFSFKVTEVVTMKNACMALRDFRHCGLVTMRTLFYNNRLLQDLMDQIAPEEEVLQELRMTVYGPEAAKLEPEELEKKRKELKDGQANFNKADHIIKLFTVSKADFQSSLNNLDNFDKKVIYQGQQNQTEIDRLTAYMDLEAEGIIK